MEMEGESSQLHHSAEMPVDKEHGMHKRVMTRDGRVSDHNLYGNLTGVQNRVNTSIAESSSQKTKHFTLSKGSLDAQSKSNNIMSELNSDSGRASLATATD